MKKTTLSLLLTFLSSNYLYSQTSAPAIVIEKWADKPAIHSVNDKYGKESAVILSDIKRVEYIDDKKGDVLEYYTLHKLVHVNDDRAIERYNKIYLGFNEKSDVIDVKARTILPNGKVFELNKNNIKDIKEEDGNIYKIFAMEGLEKGCEVEYFYTVRKPVSYMGREIMQSDLPQIETTFEIICPERLRFDLKPYNFNWTNADTVVQGKRFVKCSLKETNGADEEKYSDYVANLKRIEFKLSYNDGARKGERLFTWNELARRIYGMYSTFSPKENTLVLNMVKENGWEKIDEDARKIIAIENYVKKRFSFNDDLNDEEPNRLETVLKNRTAGTIGTMRLYTAIFQNLGIYYQYVLAGDRSKEEIDRNFENWNNCDYALFFFPSLNKFIAPTRPDYRYPWIMPNWGAANAIFFRRTTLGNVSTAIAEIKNVELEDYAKSINNIESKLEFSKDLDSLTIDAHKGFSGYAAVDIRDAFNYSNDDNKQKIVKQFAKMISGSENIVSSEVLNPEFEKATENLPVVIHIKTKSGELIEKAGNKVLIKIGQAIGPQVQMYQEKPRLFPVNIEYPQIEERKLNLIIPQGYVVKNLNDLNISQIYKDNGEVTMQFESSYKLNGNVLSVHIMEDYRKTFYPLNQFEQFRKIINSSSDFNKVVLVLEKQ